MRLHNSTTTARWLLAESRNRKAGGRRGFTIIELLVSIGLVILIMAVLAEAFTVGLNTFSNLKAVGDMSDRLRAATHQIRRDLAADHFEGAIRVSDPTFQTRTPPPPGQAPDWPREGFFYIRQYGPTPNSYEGGSENPPIPSFRAPDPPNGVGSHALYMTVKLKGNRKENFFGATAPAGAQVLTQPTTFFNQPADARYQDTGTLYTSQWAEVAYFLQPLKDQSGNPMSANGTPLYSLHRLIRVLVADNRQINGTADPNNPDYGGFSLRMNNGQGWFNTPLDVTTPNNRSLAGFFQTDPITQPGFANVSTMLLTDVVSFDVQAIPAPILPPPPMQQPPPFGFPVNTPPPQGGNDSFVDVPRGVFDSSMGWPLPIGGGNTGISAVQVIIRVWDLRTQQTRQITLLQDM
jgi:type II secretory pathway pseudopilin PulG